VALRSFPVQDIKLVTDLFLFGPALPRRMGSSFTALRVTIPLFARTMFGGKWAFRHGSQTAPVTAVIQIILGLYLGPSD